jgi:hypothetical protein
VRELIVGGLCWKKVRRGDVSLPGFTLVCWGKKVGWPFDPAFLLIKWELGLDMWWAGKLGGLDGGLVLGWYNKIRVQMVCLVTRTNFATFPNFKDWNCNFSQFTPRTKFVIIPKFQSHFSIFQTSKFPRDLFCHFWIFRD